MNRIRVAAPARLHMGMFDLAGSLGRRFGGIGANIKWPQVIIEAAVSDELRVEGPGSRLRGQRVVCASQAVHYTSFPGFPRSGD